ncbi:MAG TPA: SAM-dependent methyltransferase, partial [Actinoplanes sp.]|nr:SAM-dependent methyltransferase [Actinoplanes sp.]
MPRRPDAIITPNRELREHRRRLPSPHRAGQSLSRSEFADAVNRHLHTLYPQSTALEVDARWVGKLERGETRWPCEERRAALRRVTGVTVDSAIGLYSPRLSPEDPVKIWEPREVDIAAPHPARRYNYWLGGKDHFAADRESAGAISRVFPGAVTAARANREFLRRTVHYLNGRGVRQFVDVGAGLPATENVHDMAPAARVLYVD